MIWQRATKDRKIKRNKLFCNIKNKETLYHTFAKKERERDTYTLNARRNVRIKEQQRRGVAKY
jgi:hypothetical protein